MTVLTFYKVKIHDATPQDVQRLLSLMGKVRNLFAITVGRYTKTASQRRDAFQAVKTLWVEAARTLAA